MKSVIKQTGITFMMLGLLACQTLPGGDETAAVVINKSPNDERNYAYFELQNQLRVVVVSDPEVKKAAVSLDVATGSKDDPEDRQGLAHFLEHMLFLGTEKYPTAGEYQEFIATHGGQHNAYTSFENTNYFFDVEAPYLEAALDRFSQFFVSPLFNETYVDREKHAVESEYRTKLKNEARRGLDAFKAIVNPAHPFSLFSVGNLDTLADRPDSAVRDELIAFYSEHYSANRMTLVVLGSESVETLRAMVEQRFNQVPDHQLPEYTIAQPLFAAGTLPAQLYITPEQDMRNLEFTFPIDDPIAQWRAKPIHMVADILGHEGEGSLLQYLKKQGWAVSLSAGLGLEYHGGATFNVGIRLTESGYAARDEVVRAFFQTVNRMVDDGIGESRFDEQRKISDIQFRFQDKRENIHYVMGIATGMRRYPPAEVLQGPYLFREFKPDLYQHYLAQLRPDNVLITVTGPDLPVDTVSLLYRTPFGLAPLTQHQLSQWQGAGTNTAIVLPGANPFIPSDFVRHQSPYPDDKPRNLQSESNLQVWHGDNAEFTAPRASLRLGLQSPEASKSAENAVLLRLYAALITDSLNPKLYPALLAGFNPRLSAGRRGLELAIDGFSDKQAQLLELMLAEVQQAPFDPQRFSDIRGDLVRSWQNTKRAAPYKYLSRALRESLYTPYWSTDSLIAAAADLTVADLENYRQKVLQQLRIDMLSYGNTTAAQARKISSLIAPLLPSNVDSVELPGVNLAVLPDDQRWHYAVDLEHSDAAMMYYVQGRSDDNHQRVLMAITGQIIRSPYYHSLRTEQQFGYIVYAATTVLERTPGLSFIVQSPVADAATLVAATDTFMARFGQSVEQMGDGDFQQNKSALLSQINRPYKNLAQQAGSYWGQAAQGYSAFDRRAQLSQALEKLQLSEWRAFYKAEFEPRAQRAIIVTQQGKRGAGEWPDSTPLENTESFKQGQAQRHYP